MTNYNAEDEEFDLLEARLLKGKQDMTARARQIGGDHYKKMGIEPWDVVDTWPYEQRIGYYRGGALKYVMRSGNKDDEIQEAGKAIHYLEKLIETLKTKTKEQL